MLCAQIGLRGRPQALAGQGGARAKLHRALGELGAQRPRGAGGGAQRCGEGGGQNQRRIQDDEEPLLEAEAANILPELLKKALHHVFSTILTWVPASRGLLEVVMT